MTAFNAKWTKIIVGLACVIAVAWLSVGAFRFIAKIQHEEEYPDGTDAHFIGYYPPLKRIRNGMSRVQVEKILGVPTRRFEKKDSPAEFTSEEASIISASMYSVPGWRGEIWVYFDKQGNVVSRDWGFA